MNDPGSFMAGIIIAIIYFRINLIDGTLAIRKPFCLGRITITYGIVISIPAVPVVYRVSIVVVIDIIIYISPTRDSGRFPVGIVSILMVTFRLT